MDRFDDAMNFKNNNHCWHKNVFISRSMYLIGIAHTTVDVRNIFDGRVYSTSFRVVGRMLGPCWTWTTESSRDLFVYFFVHDILSYARRLQMHRMEALRVLRKFDVTNVIATSERQLYVRSNHLHANKTKENCCVFRPQTQTVRWY